MPTNMPPPRLLHRLRCRLASFERDERGEIPMSVLVIGVGLFLGALVASVLVSHYVGGGWRVALGGAGGALVVTTLLLVAGWLADVRAERRRMRDERGASTAIIVLFTLALLSVAGLVIDGGYALGAKREAMNEAEQAARVGADALNVAGLRDGVAQVDPDRAVTAVQAYLNQVGANGTVTVNGGEVTVTVTGQQDTKILSAVGVSNIPVKATATALSIDQDE